MFREQCKDHYIPALILYSLTTDTDHFNVCTAIFMFVGPKKAGISFKFDF